MFDGLEPAAGIRQLREAVASYAESFDAAVLSGADARRVVEDAAAVENIAATVKALAAGRVAETGVWRRGGSPSAAHELALVGGTSVAKAREVLDVASRMPALPALAAAARAGELSMAKAAPVADAAWADPAAEVRLVERAKTAGLGEVLDQCARVKAAAEPDPDARHRAIRASRYLRRCRTADGAGELRWRSSLDELAEIWSVVSAHARRGFERARAEGRLEAEEAYLADGLLAAVRAGAPGAGGGDGAPASASKVIVRVDWDSLVRGFPAGDEVCEIAGVGPVPVSLVRGMIESGDPFLATVVTKGTDVVSVAHLGRKPTAFQRTALQWRAPTCVAEGCNRTSRLEIDHRVDWARSRITALDLLDPCCSHHHALKTYRAWAFVPGSGKRPMVPPHDPRHPRHAGGDRARDGPAAAS